MSFQMGERLKNISERENLVEFVRLSPEEALRFNLRNLRASVSELAQEIAGAQREAELSTEKGNFFMWWVGSQGDERAPSCVFLQGEKEERFRAISFPVTNWSEKNPLSAISFTYIDGTRVVHIPNTRGLSSRARNYKRALNGIEGTQWFANILLNWEQ